MLRPESVPMKQAHEYKVTITEIPTLALMGLGLVGGLCHDIRINRAERNTVTSTGDSWMMRGWR